LKWVTVGELGDAGDRQIEVTQFTQFTRVPQFSPSPRLPVFVYNMSMAPNGFRFSRQEEKVLALSMEGLTDSDIAEKMGIGLGTVRTFWKRIRSKTGSGSRSDVIKTFSGAVPTETTDASQLQLIAEVRRRQLAEDAVERQKSRIAGILATIAEPAFVMAGNELEFANPSWQEDVGSDSATFPWGNVHPMDEPRTIDLWSQSQAKRSNFEMECRIRTRTGAYRPCLLRIVPTDGGTWIGTLKPIKTDESAMYKQAFLRARVGIGVIDLEGVLQVVNDRFAELLGHQPGGMIPETPGIRDLLRP